MCGIFGFTTFRSVVEKLSVLHQLLDGLERMSYRGYDSYGAVMMYGDETFYEKISDNRKDALKEKMIQAMVKDGDDKDSEVLKSSIGMGHTRWATHGEPTENNAHPIKSDDEGQFYVVHNGTITNYADLKKNLKNLGHTFYTETDTEVAAKLVLHEYNLDPNRSFEDLCKAAVSRIKGQYAFIFISKHFPGEMIAMRHQSPVAFGIIKKGRTVKEKYDEEEYNQVERPSFSYDPSEKAAVFFPDENCTLVFASDIEGLLSLTRDHVVLHEGESAVISKDKFMIRTGDAKKSIDIWVKDIDLTSVDKYKHKMLKEIYDQRKVIMNALKDRIDLETGKVSLPQLDKYKEILINATEYTFLACGTSLHSCEAVQMLFQELTGKKVRINYATSFVDSDSIVYPNDVVFVASQSGETQDLINAINYCKERGAICVGLTNVPSSRIALATHCGLNIRAGAEKSVASTKAYTCQVMNFVLVALYISQALEEKEQLESREMFSALVSDGVGYPVEGEVMNFKENLMNGDAELEAKSIEEDFTRLVSTLSEPSPRSLKMKEIVEELKVFQEKIDRALNVEIDDLVESLSVRNSILIAGRGHNVATAQEAALKIKEVSYIHAEAIPGGELKHGPLALVCEDISVIVVITNDRVLEQMTLNYKQIESRLKTTRPFILTVESLEGTLNADIVVPDTIDCLQCILNIFPLQKLAYRLALARNVENPDKPRNLAKSVTVA